MTDMLCGYPGRDEMLVTYLYDDPDDTERAVFASHVATCKRCRADLAALRGVRTHLAQWEPPSVMGHPFSGGSPQRAMSLQPRATTYQPALSSQPSATAPKSPWWREVPAWAQVAAAVVCLGVGAGLANLNIHYDQQGLTVRTGWLPPAVQAPAAGERTTGAPATVAETTPWRTDLSALERQLRTEFRSMPVPAAATAVRASQPSMSDAELLRRVRALVEESERKQERELALRVGQVIRDVNAQRQADLRKIDSNLGFIQSNTGAEVMKQRQLLMNYIVRASSQK
jgi:hypothetical protein